MNRFCSEHFIYLNAGKYHNEHIETVRIFRLQNINKLQTDLASLCVLAQQADLHPNTFKNCKLENIRKLFQPIHETYEYEA
jgi:hypothetical protein